MGLHPSLKIDSAGAQQRTVLTRIERIKEMMKKGLWKDDQNVTALPKSKIIKIKARKKVKEEKKDEAADGAKPAAGGKAAAGAKAPAAKAPTAKAPAAKPAAGGKK